MAGIIKIYGVIFVGIVVIAGMLNFNTRITLEDDIFESTRSTQLSTLEENLNLGDLFVNRKYTISQEDTINCWIKQFKENKDTKLNYIVDILSVHEDPPALAVRVRGYSNLSMTEEKLEIDYTNVILLDEGGEHEIK